MVALLFNKYTIAILVAFVVVGGIWKSGYNYRDKTCNLEAVQAELANVRRDLKNTQKALAQEQSQTTLLLKETAERKRLIDGYVSILGKDPNKFCDLTDDDLTWLRNIRKGVQQPKR